MLGCVLSPAAVVGLGSRVLGPWWTVLAVTVAFTFAFSVTASSDETGPRGVGALLVAFGVAAGSTLLAMVVTVVASRRRARAAQVSFPGGRDQASSPLPPTNRSRSPRAPSSTALATAGSPACSQAHSSKSIICDHP